MVPSTTRIGLALLGLLLVTVPLYGPALAVTGPDYVYEATELTVEDNRLGIVDEGLLYGGGIDGIDCYAVGRPHRSCAFEAAALDGNVTADHPDVTGVTGSPGALTTTGTSLTATAASSCVRLTGSTGATSSASDGRTRAQHSTGWQPTSSTCDHRY